VFKPKQFFGLPGTFGAACPVADGKGRPGEGRPETTKADV